MTDSHTKNRLGHAGSPFFQLLLRATLWAPVAVLLFALWIASLLATLVLPAYAIACFYFGDAASGLLFLAGSVMAYFLSRFLTRSLWECPESVL